MLPALALFFTIIPFSFTHAAEPQGYVGAGIGNAFHDTDFTGLTGTASLDENDIGYKIFAGLKLNDYLAFEAFYADLGEAELTGNSGDGFRVDGIPFTFSTNNASINSEVVTFGLNGVFYLPLDKMANNPSLSFFTPFATLGFHIWDIDAVVSDPAIAVGTLSDDGSDIFAGAGFDIKVTDNFLARVEYDYFKMDDDNTGFLALSAIINF